MKMVSAARLKKAQDAILRIRPYAGKLEEILALLSSETEKVEDSPFMQPREPGKVLIVLMSSNRGLCGAFNSSVAKASIELAVSKYGRQLKLGNVDFWAIGKQGEKYLKLRQMKIVGQANELFDNLDFDHTSALAARLLSFFSSKKYDRVELVYNKFLNAALQECQTEQLLPVEMKKDSNQKMTNYNFLLEPSAGEIMNEMIPRMLKIQFYRALLDSNVSEHGARMTAMHKATDNATDLIRELTLTFNKARQGAITNEIIEVTSGAEAMNG